MTVEVGGRVLARIVRGADCRVGLWAKHVQELRSTVELSM